MAVDIYRAATGRVVHTSGVSLSHQGRKYKGRFDRGYRANERYREFKYVIRPRKIKLLSMRCTNLLKLQFTECASFTGKRKRSSSVKLTSRVPEDTGIPNAIVTCHTPP